MQAEHLARLLGVPGLGAKLGDVERCLVESLDNPTALAAASRRVTDAGGKRLRPALQSPAGLTDVYDERVVTAAAAAELVQLGSLVHDDLLDGALTRCGTPTINAVEGVDMALLAGDSRLARAGQLAGSLRKTARPGPLKRGGEGLLRATSWQRGPPSSRLSLARNCRSGFSRRKCLECMQSNTYLQSGLRPCTSPTS